MGNENKPFRIKGTITAMWILAAVIIIANIMGMLHSCDDSDGTLKPDHWYHNDLVNVQNCVVADSYVRVAGDVFVSYYPVCRECHEPGPLSVAYLTEDNSHLKTYRCECGGQTTIRINVY